MLNESNIPLEEDGIEEEILVDEEVAITKAMWGDIGGNIENQTDLQNALDAKQDSLTEVQLNAVNSGITAEKVTTYDGYADQIASKANQSALNAEATTRQQADTALGRRIDDEATARQNADNGLQTQIDAITSKSDVVDVVANYAALQAYDTSTLGNNDVIKVLDDETHEDALTYYRWSTTTQTWSYIGQEAPYYSKGQMDVKLAEKQDKLTAGANIQIHNGTISATDTTYTAGNGLNLNGTEFSADTDVLATKEDLESYYTKPETDNLLAPKLEAEVVAELPTTGEEGKLYLTPKAHTTQTATGNPITATVAEDAGAIESFQLDGDTFQQTYTGKNLFDDNTATDAYIQSNGAVTPNSAWRSSQLIKVEPNTSYTWHGDVYGVHQVVWAGYNSSQAFISGQYAQVNNVNSLRIITGENTEYIRVGYRSDGMRNMQLELGATASDYEPFVGGIPSPSPDYPQPIQTVTGLQTISINGTDYPIDLGSIELCKLGDYQDYIYKDGDSWKVHKATATITLDGSSDENWQKSNNVFFEYSGYSYVGDVGVGSTALSPSFIYWPNTGSISNNMPNLEFGLPATKVGIGIRNDSIADTDALRTWLATNVFKAYVSLATATDTTITDQTLIAQLEAIRTASLQNGANTITNTATGSNLAGDMEIGYYGYNPTNRYDKWLWLDINNEYEQIGS